ncbi:hypothetical protein AAVH_17999 [Aphelenchoides avenae]|nr:hypothetical protein AAVH_17999 [Aphelenchus avenae]
MLALLRHRLFRYLEDSMLPLKLGCMLVPAGALVIIGPFAMARRSFEELRNATLSQAPFMECVFDQRSSIVGFESVGVNPWYEFCMQELVVFLVFGLLLMTALNVGCFVLIRRQKRMMSTKSYDMNIMLYKTLTVQMVLILLLLVVPAIATGIALQFKFPYANDIVMSCFAIASTHAFIEFGCTLYFIKRYRLFIERRIGISLDYIWKNRNKSLTQDLRMTYFTSRSTG